MHESCFCRQHVYVFLLPYHRLWYGSIIEEWCNEVHKHDRHHTSERVHIDGLKVTYHRPCPTEFETYSMNTLQTRLRTIVLIDGTTWKSIRFGICRSCTSHDICTLFDVSKKTTMQTKTKILLYACLQCTNEKPRFLIGGERHRYKMNHVSWLSFCLQNNVQHKVLKREVRTVYHSDGTRGTTRRFAK